MFKAAYPITIKEKVRTWRLKIIEKIKKKRKWQFLLPVLLIIIGANMAFWYGTCMPDAPFLTGFKPGGYYGLLILVLGIIWLIVVMLLRW